MMNRFTQTSLFALQQTRVSITGCCIVIATSIFLAYIFAFGAPFIILPDSPGYFMDFEEFIRAGYRIIPVRIARSLGYPAFLSLVAELFDTNSALALKVAQQSIIVASRILLFIIAYSITRNTAHSVAAVLINETYLATMLYGNVVMTETLYMFSVTLTCLFSILAVRFKPNHFYYILAMASSAGAAWVRPQAKLLWVVIVFVTAPFFLRAIMAAWAQRKYTYSITSSCAYMSGIALALLLMSPMQVAPSYPEARQLATTQQGGGTRIVKALGTAVWFRLYHVDGYSLEGVQGARILEAARHYLQSHPESPEGYWRIPEGAMTILTTELKMSETAALDLIFDITTQAILAAPLRFTINTIRHIFWCSVTTGGDAPYVNNSASFTHIFPNALDSSLLYKRIFSDPDDYKRLLASDYFRIYEDKSIELASWIYLYIHKAFYRHRNAALFILLLGPGLLLASANPNRRLFAAPLLIYLYHISLWVLIPVPRYYTAIDGMANIFHALGALFAYNICKTHILRIRPKTTISTQSHTKSDALP